MVTHETRFVYDGNQIVLQLDTNGGGTMTVGDLSHRYLWGPATDQLLSDEQVTNVSEPGTLVLPLTDNVGTVRDLAICSLTTGTTAVVNHLDYSSFGQVLSQTNPATGNTAAVDCLFGFTGRALDTNTGLQNNTNRWYDASIGRWIIPDPTGFTAGDTNEYRYCGNSPANAVDPSGLDKTIDEYLMKIEWQLERARIMQRETGGWKAAIEAEKTAAATAYAMYDLMSWAGPLKGESLAAAFMSNWLKGAPRNPYSIDSSVQAAIDNKTGPYQSLEAWLTEWVRKQSGTSGVFDTAMLTGLKNSPWIYVYATGGEFYHSLGGFEVKFQGTWKRSGDKVEFTGVWTIQDTYSWKKGLTANVAGSKVPDDYALLVEKWYKAKQFTVVGSWTGTIEFNLANPAAMPFAGFNPKDPHPGSSPPQAPSPPGPPTRGGGGGGR